MNFFGASKQNVSHILVEQSVTRGQAISVTICVTGGTLGFREVGCPGLLAYAYVPHELFRCHMSFSVLESLEFRGFDLGKCIF